MTKVNVEINFKLWVKKIKSPKKYLNYRLKKVFKILPILKKKNISFTILLTNSSNMKKLNKKFRNRNKTTDVLSFPYLFIKRLGSIKKNMYIGDIALCYEIINARSDKGKFSLEFDKAWIHGFLHLLGYNHIKNKDFYKMNNIENKILNKII